MTRDAIDRRRALTLLSAFAALLSPIARAADADLSAGAASLTQGLDASAIHALATEYRVLHPSDAGTQAVLMLLQDASNTPARLKSRLRTLIMADYHADRIVQLAGWHLSRTEARVFAALSDILRRP